MKNRRLIPGILFLILNAAGAALLWSLYIRAKADILGTFGYGWMMSLPINANLNNAAGMIQTGVLLSALMPTLAALLCVLWMLTPAEGARTGAIVLVWIAAVAALFINTVGVYHNLLYSFVPAIAAAIGLTIAERVIRKKEEEEE